MTNLLALESATTAQNAFARLFSLATWIARQGDEFSFDDVAAAFGDDYAGSHDAVDRRWSRDKLALAALGVTARLVTADTYLFEVTSRRVRLSPDRSAALVTAVRALPVTGNEALETGLRKLLAAGAPILGALMTRAAAGGAPSCGDKLAHQLSVAYLLVVLLQAAGVDGLSLEEAVVATGARDADELVRVVGLLTALRLPFDAPDDEVPVYVEDGRVALYMFTPVMPVQALTEPEMAALALAGIEGFGGGSVSQAA